MQDRTPQIVDTSFRVAPYTGNYASLLLRTLRLAPRGLSTEGLMGSLGLISRRDQQFPAFSEAMAYLVELGLIGCPEYDALPKDEKRLELHFVWGIK